MIGAERIHVGGGVPGIGLTDNRKFGSQQLAGDRYRKINIIIAAECDYATTAWMFQAGRKQGIRVCRILA